MTNQIYVPTVAALMARGCPDDALDHAYTWLQQQRIADTIAELVAQLDEAIAVATAMTS